MHRLDARSKTILLLVYSIGLFFCDEWLGLALYLIGLIIVLLLSRLPASRVFLVSVPVYVIVAIALLGNAFVFVASGDPGIEAGQVLWGGLCFSLPGFLRGAFYGLRILLLVWASLVFCFTTTQEEMAASIAWFLEPLARLRVPVDDIAMIASIALRFIPLTAAEFFQIRDAQWARGRSFDEGGPIVRIKAYGGIFVPLFVGLFRRADILSRAMDCRLYGLPGQRRTALYHARMSTSSVGATVVGSAAFAAIAWLL